MLPLVLLALAASVMGVAAVLGAAVLRVAWAGPQAMPVRGATWPTWQPPPIHGDELLAWATAAARGEVTDRLARSRGARLARKIARGMQAGARRAIGHSPQPTVPRAEHACSSCRHHRLGVTPPEVLSIVEVLAERPAKVRRSIAARARENAQRSRSLSRAEYESAGFVCPLLLDGQTCAANGCRPLECRGWLRLAGDEAGGAGPAADPALDEHAWTVSRGVRAGMAEALRASGLDAACYELNSALVVALEEPDAAERWSRGEALFAECPRCEE